MRIFVIIEANSSPHTFAPHHCGKFNLPAYSEIIARATILTYYGGLENTCFYHIFTSTCAICTNRSQSFLFFDKRDLFAAFGLLLLADFTLYYIFFEIVFFDIYPSKKQAPVGNFTRSELANIRFLSLCFYCFLGFLLEIRVQKIGQLFIGYQSCVIYRFRDIVAVFFCGEIKIFGRNADPALALCQIKEPAEILCHYSRGIISKIDIVISVRGVL